MTHENGIRRLPRTERLLLNALRRNTYESIESDTDDRSL